MKTKKFQSKEIVSDDVEEPQGSEGAGEVAQVYDELKVFEKPASVSLVSRPVVALLVGLLSGIVGALLVFGDVFGIMGRLLGNENGTNGRTIILERRERIDVPWEESKEKIFHGISKSVHGVYRLKGQVEGTDPIRGVYFGEDQVGVAVAVTADGWLVTSSVAVKERGEYGVLIAGRVYQVDKTVSDPYAGVAFLKVAVQDLQSVRFGTRESDLGTIGVIGSMAASVFRGELVGLVSSSIRSVSGKNPYESSERNSSFLAFDSSGKPLPGTGVFNLSGELIGLFDGQFGFIKAFRISKVLPHMLKEGKIEISSLGVATLDLGYLGIDQRASLVPLQGARVQTIATNSPASQAKLQVGDVIVKVEDEALTGAKTFSELIQEYQPGTKVTLEILRNSDTLKVDVTLGKQ